MRGALWLVLLGFFAGGCTTLPKARVSPADFPAQESARVTHNLGVFNAAWDLVNRKHYDPKYAGIDWEAAAAKYGPQAAAAADERSLYRVLNTMLGELHDSHTQALTPAQAEERRTRMRARTGFNMERLDEKWIVTEVVPESPAALAGVKPGWIVISLNGEVLGARLDFRAKEGEEMKWEFINDREERVLLRPVARSLSTAPLQVARDLGDGIWYLRFDEFDGKDRRWLSAQLKLHAAARGVVIDLRRNPGGDTFSLGTAIGEFFNHSVDCGTFITRAGARSVKDSWQIGSARYAGDVVVLVGASTGSAAEIFSAVLQDHGRAKLVGRRTAGAVLASWFYRLPDGGQLQLSREDYVAPKGRRIEGNGLEPNVVVSRSLDDVRHGRDSDLAAALRLLKP